MKKHYSALEYEDLDSEFDFGDKSETCSLGEKRPRIQEDDLWKKPQFGKSARPRRNEAKYIFDDEQSRIERKKYRLMTLDVYTRHKELINQYYLCHPGATAKLQRDTTRDRTDYDVLKDTHRFLWDDDQLAKAAEKSWEARLAKRYYDKLFKEYCIADLSHYKKRRIAMRWRTEKEVRSGKGQFECGSKRCNEKENLTSWEVNFAYNENGVKKNALVKLRLCPECSKLLNYYSQKRKHEKKEKRGSGKRTYYEECKEAESLEQPNSSRVQNSPSFEENAEDKSGEQTFTDSKSDNSVEIWRKPPDDIDPEKAAEQELDDFLDDLLL